MIVTYSCWVFVVKLGSRDLFESTRVPFGGMGHLLTYCELQALLNISADTQRIFTIWNYMQKMEDIKY